MFQHCARLVRARVHREPLASSEVSTIHKEAYRRDYSRLTSDTGISMLSALSCLLLCCCDANMGASPPNLLCGPRAFDSETREYLMLWKTTVV
jgi:hypothetical protein